MPQLWHKLPEESSKAFKAFCVYRDLDPMERSAVLTSKILGLQSQRSMEVWSAKYRWV